METSTDEILSTKKYKFDYRYFEYLLSPAHVPLSLDHIHVKYLYISNIFLVLLGVRDIENEVREHFLSFWKKDD